jgi:hypothetical protein
VRGLCGHRDAPCRSVGGIATSGPARADSPLTLPGWRVRQALGLPEDAYDLTARIVRERDRARWAAENG